MTDPYSLPEWSAWVRAIRENPDDDTVRLVAADWLQEHGQDARAEFVRREVGLARRPTWEGMGEGDRGPVIAAHNRELAAVRRLFVAAVAAPLAARLGVVVSGPSASRKGCFTYLGPRPWEGRPSSLSTGRGFVDSLRLPAADWLVHGDALYAREPVARVVLTDPPGEFAELTVPGKAGHTRYRVAGQLVEVPTGACLVEAFSARWPGIDFEVPAGNNGRVYPAAAWQPDADARPLTLNVGRVYPPATNAGLYDPPD